MKYLKKIFKEIMRKIPHKHTFLHPEESCSCREGKRNMAIRYCSVCDYEESLYSNSTTLVGKWKPSPKERIRNLRGAFDQPNQYYLFTDNSGLSINFIISEKDSLSNSLYFSFIERNCSIVTSPLFRATVSAD